METLIIKISEAGANADDLKDAAEIIRNGGLVAFPTETVYGLGGNALDPDASKKIYAAKGRPSDNPLIVHISSVDQLDGIADGIPEKAKKLMDAYWPGPMTLIFKKKPSVPDETTGGLDSVAVRMPVHPVAKALIDAAGLPIAAPSANVSGRPSPTKAEHVIEDLNGRIDMIIDGGQSEVGLESTIIDVSSDDVYLLRPGGITVKMIEDVIGSIGIDKAVTGPLKDGERPKAPGMKYRHYAPKAELTIVSGDIAKVQYKINRLATVDVAEGRKVGVIATDESRGAYPGTLTKSIGSRNDKNAVAHNLFDVLREFDKEDVDVIYSEAFDDNDIGFAIMNRLRKSAGYKIIEV